MSDLTQNPEPTLPAPTGYLESLPLQSAPRDSVRVFGAILAFLGGFGVLMSLYLLISGISAAYACEGSDCQLGGGIVALFGLAIYYPSAALAAGGLSMFRGKPKHPVIAWLAILLGPQALLMLTSANQTTAWVGLGLVVLLIVGCLYWFGLSKRT